MSYEKEKKALAAIANLAQQADECRALCDEVGMEYPPLLKRLLGMESVSGTVTSNPHKIGIPQPKTPHRPAGIPSDWIAVPKGSVTAQTFVTAYLRHAGRGIKARQIVEAARDSGLEVSAGSVANIGTRFKQQGIIEQTKDEGWKLVDDSNAPVLAGEYVWGSTDMFTRHELASRRREMILYVLNHFPEGLQNLQILARLEAFEWLQTPLNKDLVKMDMEDLQKAGKVRRLGNSRKWTLAEPR